MSKRDTTVAKRVTPRMVKALELAAGGKHIKTAMREAGYPEGGIRVQLARLRSHEDLGAAVELVLHDHGVTLDVVAEKLKDSLDATMVQSFCTKSGEVVHTEPMVDNQTRLKAVELSARLLGADRKARDFVAAEVREHVPVNILVVAEASKSLSDEQLDDVIRRIQVGSFDPSSLPSAEVAPVETG